MKFLNYSDMIFYKENGISISGLRYAHLPYGPVPENYDMLFGRMSAEHRYVDDVFIFADSEKLANEIVELYSEAARKYLLRLNEEKISKNKVPFVLDFWLNETNLFTNRAVTLLFNSKSERKTYASEHQSDQNEENVLPHLLKSEGLSTSKRSIMNQFNELICKYESKDRTIVAYFLGTLLNKVGRNKEKVRIFKEDVSENVVFNFLELALYVYSFFPNYNNTQRLFERYAFIFDKANLNDIVNLILFCHQAKIEIPFRQEEKIVEQLVAKDDPILWASYLLYSQYSCKYYNEIRSIIGATLNERLDAIIPNAVNTAAGNPGAILGNVFVEFLKNSIPLHKSETVFLGFAIHNSLNIGNVIFG